MQKRGRRGNWVRVRVRVSLLFVLHHTIIFGHYIDYSILKNSIGTLNFASVSSSSQ